MAIDYIIGALQLLSAAVNVLALGSFWITPGLRTTANRFVINLLIVNIVGCLALTPALWLHGGLIPTVYSETHHGHDNAVAFNARPPTPSSLSTIKPSTFVKIFATEQIFDDNYDEEIFANIQEDTIQANRTKHNQTIVITNINETWSPTKNIQYSDCTRFWGFDLVAALGMYHPYLVFHVAFFCAPYLFFFQKIKTNNSQGLSQYILSRCAVFFRWIWIRLKNKQKFHRFLMSMR